jgi:hypothetical protein
MTVDGVVGGILLAIFTGLLGLLIGGKKKVSEDTFNDHIKSAAPHIACPVHTEQLSNMARVLDRIDKRIYRLMGGVGEEE